MVSLVALWLPIVLAAVVVFFVSAIVHMVLPYHRSDYSPLPDESSVTDAIHASGAPPGTYMFPHCASQSELGTPEVQEKFKRGPVGVMMLRPPGPPSMGKPLAQWFAFCLLMMFFSAYVASITLAPGTHYLRVFRIVGTVAFMGFGIGHISNSIWLGERWSTTIKHVFDGLLYALFAAGVFGWLWPKG